MSGPRWVWQGRVPYARARERVLAHRESVIARRAAEQIWCLEHPPVITTGRRSAGPLPSPDALRATGTDLVATERGGLATWHGPGQLVVWPVVDIGRRRIPVRRFVEVLEEGVMGWLAGLGLAAGRRPGAPGVWVQGGGGWHKLCAVGLHISRGVSVHGLALNLCPSLEGFGLIVPCGIRDGAVTSLAELGVPHPQMPVAAEQLGSLLSAAIHEASRWPAGEEPTPVG